jgi:hypothetical protein
MEEDIMSASPRAWWGPESPPAYQETSAVFAAKFPGSCARCGTSFDAGADVFYADGELVALDGCDEVSDDEAQSLSPDIPVMPRGKTKQDRCDRCFIIHASGQVDCE